MIPHEAWRRRLRCALAFAFGLMVWLLVPGRAEAQVITSSGFPARLQYDSDASVASRPAGYNPNGIDYADCADDIDLSFDLTLTDSPSADEIQIWAGPTTVDCTLPDARSSGTGGSAGGRCWMAAAPLSLVATSTSVRVHVRDVVQYLGVSDPPTTYMAATSLSACRPPSTAPDVPMGLYFMFVPAGSTGASLGNTTPFEYEFYAALVGPYEPEGVTIADGGISSGSLTVSWTPLTETDSTGHTVVQGYDVYIEDLGGPDSGTGGADVAVVTNVTSPIYCYEHLPCTVHDAGKSDKDGGGATDGGCDGGESDAQILSGDASLTSLSDAELQTIGCQRHPGRVILDAASVGGGVACVAGSLVNTFTVDGGTSYAASTVSDADTTTTTDATVDAGDDGAAEAAMVAVNPTGETTSYAAIGGISTIPSRYLFTQIAGADTSSYTFTGLVNDHTYVIGVAAYDGSGNVGPVGITCGFPQPVISFYGAYSEAGGLAGGGFCSLPAAGAPIGGSLFSFGMMGAVFAILRRRRARQTRSDS